MSSIKPKIGKCPDCIDDVEKPLIGGKCQTHYWRGRARKKKIKTSNILHAASKLVYQATGSSLSFWYGNKMKNLTGVCMECGGKINKHNQLEAHCAVAHIFPKAQFDSVKTHEENSLELCATNACHSRFDKSWESASKMKVWPVAAKKIMIIAPFIDESEKGKVYDLIMDYATRALVQN